MAKSKALNNLEHFYLESGCSNLKVFAQKYGLSYNTLTEQIRNDVEPTEDTIRTWCNKCGLERTYFEQNRKELTLEDLHYWHHTKTRYTLDEFYDAASKVSEDFNLDRDALQRALSEHHN